MQSERSDETAVVCPDFLHCVSMRLRSDGDDIPDPDVGQSVDLLMQYLGAADEVRAERGRSQT